MYRHIMRMLYFHVIKLYEYCHHFSMNNHANCVLDIQQLFSHIKFGFNYHVLCSIHQVYYIITNYIKYQSVPFYVLYFMSKLSIKILLTFVCKWCRSELNISYQAIVPYYINIFLVISPSSPQLARLLSHESNLQKFNIFKNRELITFKNFRSQIHHN